MTPSQIETAPASALQVLSIERYQQEQQHQQHSTHSSTYYAHCLLGGVLSSSIRWVLTPLDAMKCNLQVNPHKYPSFVGGLQQIFRQEGIRGLYKGFLPTVLSYSTQTGTKYMLYEWNKDQLTRWVGGEESSVALQYRSLIYMVSAGAAEAVADILMCPWETLKVRFQTSTLSANGGAVVHPRLGPAVVALMQEPKQLLGAIGPLWSRQIAGTMANFLTFEHSVQNIYKYGFPHQAKEDLSPGTQLGVTFVAGYWSGFVSSVVSHPADSLLSLQARYPHKPLRQLVHEVGWRALATQGLGPRIALTGSIIGFQWLAYDTFKTVMGMGTTGGH